MLHAKLEYPILAYSLRPYVDGPSAEDLTRNSEDIALPSGHRSIHSSLFALLIPFWIVGAKRTVGAQQQASSKSAPYSGAGFTIRYPTSLFKVVSADSTALILKSANEDATVIVARQRPIRESEGSQLSAFLQSARPMFDTITYEKVNAEDGWFAITGWTGTSGRYQRTMVWSQDSIATVTIQWPKARTAVYEDAIGMLSRSFLHTSKQATVAEARGVDAHPLARAANDSSRATTIAPPQVSSLDRQLTSLSLALDKPDLRKWLGIATTLIALVLLTLRLPVRTFLRSKSTRAQPTPGISAGARIAVIVGVGILCVSGGVLAAIRLHKAKPSALPSEDGGGVRKPESGTACSMPKVRRAVEGWMGDHGMTTDYRVHGVRDMPLPSGCGMQVLIALTPSSPETPPMYMFTVGCMGDRCTVSTVEPR